MHIELNAVISFSAVNDVIHTHNHDNARIIKLAALEQTSGILVKRFSGHDFLSVANEEPFVISGIKAGR